MSEAGVSVGIDLGTTYSLVAVLEGGVPRILPNSVGEHLTPSAVSVSDDGTVLVGAAARARAVNAPDQTAVCFKRDMGTDVSVTLGKRTFRPEELSALVLAELKADAEAALGQPVTEAVVTVPAYFGEVQRRATQAACEIAGLNVERIINEPTAAALAYGLHARDREFSALVVDLGGGTFDVTVLEVLEGVVEIQATSGNSRLGGEDFLDRMTERVAARIESEHKLKVARTGVPWARLRDACEDAKRRLSTSTETRLAVTGLPTDQGEQDVELELERSWVEEGWGELLKRIETPIRQALRDARMTAEEIEEVLLVGGATRMPCVSTLCAKLFGRLPLKTLPPDESVALGAAVQAGLKRGDEELGDLVVTDIAPFTLGVEVVQDFGSREVTGVFSPVLERGTVLPASRVERYSTRTPNQPTLMVEVYQGEHSLVKHNQLLGQYDVKGIPRGKQHDVDIRFTYDLNGLLEVETTIVATGKKHTLVLERSPGKLDKKAIAKAREQMATLKFHPRDALPNVTALERADALYVELTAVERDVLGGAISGLRGALETQDANAIDEARGELNHLVQSLKAYSR